MTIIEKWQVFFTRQRTWPWVAGGLAAVLIGHMLEGANVLSGLQHLTESVKNGLHAVQPFAIADAFWQADKGHRGLWFCDPIDTGPGCGSVLGLANVGIASLMSVPRVGREIWHDGGWIAIILYGLTVLGIALSIISAWRDVDKPDGGFGKTLLMTAGMLALGPLVAGVVFWLLLQLLLLLTILVGAVLSGIIWLIATFGVIYKTAMLLIEGIKTGDEMEENASLFVGKGTPPPES